MKTEPAGSSVMSANIYQSVRFHNPECHSIDRYTSVGSFNEVDMLLWQYVICYYLQGNENHTLMF